MCRRGARSSGRTGGIAHVGSSGAAGSKRNKTQKPLVAKEVYSVVWQSL
jgi:hypothetical protein